MTNDDDTTVRERAHRAVRELPRWVIVLTLIVALVAGAGVAQSSLWESFEDGDTAEWTDREDLASGDFTASTNYSYGGDYSGYYRMTKTLDSVGEIPRQLPSGTEQVSFAVRIENNEDRIYIGPTIYSENAGGPDMISFDANNNIYYGGDTGVDVATSEWVIFNVEYDASNGSARATYYEDGVAHDLGVISADLPTHFKIGNTAFTRPEVYVDSISNTGNIATEITGTVTDESGAELENVTIQVTHNGSVVASTTTDANGDYTVSGVSAGEEYTVTASKDGYVPGSKTVTVESGVNTVNFELREGSKALQIDSRSLLQPGQQDTFTVLFNPGDGSRTDVTAESNVTSSNESILAVSGDTLIATEDENVSAVIQLTATTTQNGETYTTVKNITVAQPTVENLQKVPGVWRVVAVGQDDTLFALLVATFLSVPAARFTSAFGGLAVGQLVMTIGWLAGYVGFGIAAASLFVSLFIGLNLAANTDYVAGGVRR